MKKEIQVFFLIWVLFLTAPFLRPVLAEEAWTDQFQRQFSEIKDRLEAVEQQQQELMAKSDKILEELDRLRVWVHRK